MEVIHNEWLYDPEEAERRQYAPHWYKKLMAPSFFREGKLAKLYFQWNLKIGLENLKKEQAKEGRVDRYRWKEHNKILKEYVKKAYEEWELYKMRHLNITDNKPRNKKLHTTSTEEDNHFYNYKKKFDEYNSDLSAPFNERADDSDRADDLVAHIPGGKRGENGILTRYIKTEELMGAEKRKALFEKLQEAQEETADPEDEEEEDLEDLHAMSGFDPTDDFYKEYL